MRALDVNTFDQALMEADGLVLVDFWAPWCGPCRAVTPTLEALALEYEGKLDFCKVNVEDNPQLMQAFKLRSVPTVLLLKPNKEEGGARVLDAMIGARPAQAYAKWIDQHVNPPPSLLKRLAGGVKVLFKKGDAPPNDHA